MFHQQYKSLINSFSILVKFIKKIYNYIGGAMLVNLKKMMEDANKNYYAIPHLNINNLEWTKFILEECQKNNSNVILGVSEGAIKYMGGYNVVSSLVKSLINDLEIDIDVCLHLDHGSCFESCKKAIDSGFTSVMIDASKYEIDKNIEIVKEVVEYAKKYNVTVEAEVGHIGGSEDGVANEIYYATIDDCKKLVNETGIDLLAPALGSVHGFYKGEPKLNFERMKEIKEKLNIPLVLHGGTGIPDEMIKKAIECGINKINVNTELQVAWTNGVRKGLNEDKNIYDPRKVIKLGEQNLKEVVKNKIELFGSSHIK